MRWIRLEQIEFATNSPRMRLLSFDRPSTGGSLGFFTVLAKTICAEGSFYLALPRAQSLANEYGHGACVSETEKVRQRTFSQISLHPVAYSLASMYQPDTKVRLRLQ